MAVLDRPQLGALEQLTVGSAPDAAGGLTGDDIGDDDGDVEGDGIPPIRGRDDLHGGPFFGGSGRLTLNGTRPRGHAGTTVVCTGGGQRRRAPR